MRTVRVLASRRRSGGRHLSAAAPCFPLLVKNEEVVPTHLSRDKLAALYRPEVSIAKLLRTADQAKIIVGFGSYACRILMSCGASERSYATRQLTVLADDIRQACKTTVTPQRNNVLSFLQVARACMHSHAELDIAAHFLDDRIR